MAAPGWSPAPRSLRRRVLGDLAPQPSAQVSIEPERPPGVVTTTEPPLIARPLSNITEAPSQTTEDRAKENLLPASASGPEKPNPLRPHTADIDSHLSVLATPKVPRRNSSRRARNAAVLAAIDTALHPDLSPSNSTETTLASPEDSASPLAAASGRVGTLLIQIHRNRSRALIYGQLFVVGALSHQTWVSGEVLFFDVEIYNSTDKSIKKVEVQLERTTMLHPTSRGYPSAQEVQFEATNEVLAKWVWKKGEDGWCGIAPHTQAAKIWNPIVPAGQATMNTHRFGVRYSLTIFVPCTFSKTTSVRIPITVISPNSLGASRLQQQLHHGLADHARQGPRNIDGSPLKHHDNCHGRPSQDLRRPSTSHREHEELTKAQLSRELRRQVESNANSIFVTSNPIPRASDELLNEMLQKLEQTSLSPRQMARLSATGGQHRKGLSAPVQTIPAMRPLSAIGARVRRGSSEDVWPRAAVGGLSLLAPPAIPTARVSFDDNLLRPQHQRHRSKGLRLHHPHYSESGAYLGHPDAFKNSDSSSSLDESEFDRFLRERHSFQVARRTLGNPFFKGSLNKEKLRSNRYAYRAAKDRQNEKARVMGSSGQYEFHEVPEHQQSMYDRPFYSGTPGSKNIGSTHSGWKHATHTLF